MKSLLLAILSGVLLWLAWPTYGFAGLLFVAFVPLLLLERKLRNSNSRKKSARFLGLSFVAFFIWNFATTSWLYYATAVGMWFAVIVNSLLMAIVMMLYHRVARRVSQKIAFIFLICIWISFEYLHLHWDFSWPWLNLGNGFSENTSWIQWYEYTGAFGGTLWVWLVNVAVVGLVVRFRESKKNHTSFDKKQWVLPVIFILLPILWSYYLLFHYSTSITAQNQGDDVVIVQPNIDPYHEKYLTSNTKIIELIDQLVQPVMDDKVRYVITPETVLADNLHLSSIQYHPNTRQLRSLLQDYPSAYYLGGVSMIDVFRKESPQRTSQSNTRDGLTYFNDYNSAMFMGQTGPVDLYHKSKLVVGIENMPYKSVLEPILGNVMIDLGGTIATKTTQDNRKVFTTDDNTSIAPVICYESVYGDYVTDYVKNGAHYLAIITNDAWWNNTQGHQQHLSIARLRAIENRRWIARSANTGISAIIDHTGTIVNQLGYAKLGVVTGSLLPRTQLTFYTKYGDYIARLALFVAIAIILMVVVQRTRR